MKNLLLIFALFVASFAAAQVNDLELANAIMGTKHKYLEDTLRKYGVDFYLTSTTGNEYTYFISNNMDAVKMWEITIGTLETSGATYNEGNITIGDPLVIKFFIRYNHINMGHLRDFNAYEKPPNSEYITYDKSLGKKQSHFTGEMSTFRERKR